MLNLNFAIQDLEYFLLIVARVTGFVHTAPFFGMNNVPRRVKVTFSLLVSFLIYQFVVPHYALAYDTVLGYAILVFKETAAGILLGMSGNVCLYVVQLAGSLIDMDIGLSMVSLFDPATRQQVGFSGALYNYALMLILLISDMHHWILRAFVDSYEFIPTGRINFDLDSILDTSIRFLTDYFVIGFRIFLPVFAGMLILNAVLGILAKVAPQMNMFSVGIQIKILVGLGIMLITVGMLPGLSDFVFNEMKEMMTAVAGGMGTAQ
ncbi:MAG: flagellar biosynthetic protein FliR [Lachnospiraceae bacterium]|nr:flagellar biosynthetic protein FliR [Lachnospiraceae bacterium]